MKSPLVYIVILNYKNYADTLDCVHKVETINYPNYRIVIVDNDSRNKSEEILREKFPHHNIIQTGSNRGYAAGNNAGIRIALKAGADYVLILNNDTLVETDFLDKLIAYAESNQFAGIVGPKIITESGDLDLSCARRRPTLLFFIWKIGLGSLLLPNNKISRTYNYENEYDFKSIKKVDIISGSCMLIRCELLKEIGLLDENTFIYLEEFILHEKIRRTKFHTAIVPSSIIVHKKQRSIGTVNYKALWESYKSYNYYLWNYRNFGITGTVLALINVSISRAARVLKKFVGSTGMKIKNLGR